MLASLLGRPTGHKTQQPPPPQHLVPKKAAAAVAVSASNTRSTTQPPLLQPLMSFAADETTCTAADSAAGGTTTPRLVHMEAGGYVPPTLPDEAAVVQQVEESAVESAAPGTATQKGALPVPGVLARARSSRVVTNTDAVDVVNSKQTPVAVEEAAEAQDLSTGSAELAAILAAQECMLAQHLAQVQQTTPGCPFAAKAAGLQPVPSYMSTDGAPPQSVAGGPAYGATGNAAGACSARHGDNAGLADGHAAGSGFAPPALFRAPTLQRLPTISSSGGLHLEVQPSTVLGEHSNITEGIGASPSVAPIQGSMLQVSRSLLRRAPSFAQQHGLHGTGARMSLESEGGSGLADDASWPFVLSGPSASGLACMRSGHMLMRMPSRAASMTMQRMQHMPSMEHALSHHDSDDDKDGMLPSQAMAGGRLPSATQPHGAHAHGGDASGTTGRAAAYPMPPCSTHVLVLQPSAMCQPAMESRTSQYDGPGPWVTDAGLSTSTGLVVPGTERDASITEAASIAGSGPGVVFTSLGMACEAVLEEEEEAQSPEKLGSPETAASKEGATHDAEGGIMPVIRFGSAPLLATSTVATAVPAAPTRTSALASPFAAYNSQAMAGFNTFAGVSSSSAGGTADKPGIAMGQSRTLAQNILPTDTDAAALTIGSAWGNDGSTPLGMTAAGAGNVEETHGLAPQASVVVAERPLPARPVSVLSMTGPVRAASEPLAAAAARGAVQGALSRWARKFTVTAGADGVLSSVACILVQCKLVFRCHMLTSYAMC